MYTISYVLNMATANSYVNLSVPRRRISYRTSTPQIIFTLYIMIGIGRYNLYQMSRYAPRKICSGKWELFWAFSELSSNETQAYSAILQSEILFSQDFPFILSHIYATVVLSPVSYYIVILIIFFFCFCSPTHRIRAEFTMTWITNNSRAKWRSRPVAFRWARTPLAAAQITTDDDDDDYAGKNTDNGNLAIQYRWRSSHVYYILYIIYYYYHRLNFKRHRLRTQYAFTRNPIK